MLLNKSVVESKQQQAYREIKRLIVTNNLSGDTVITEKQLCDYLGISRTPIRAALAQLAKENFVSNIPGRGTIVNKISIEDIIEIFQIREVLDPLAIRFFIEKVNVSLISKMKEHISCMDKAIKTGDNFAIIEHDMAFHDCYLLNTGNSRLEQMILPLRDQIRRCLNQTYDDGERHLKAHYDHKKIITAVENRDIQCASKLVCEHMIAAREYHIGKLMK